VQASEQSHAQVAAVTLKLWREHVSIVSLYGVVSDEQRRVGGDVRGVVLPSRYRDRRTVESVGGDVGTSLNSWSSSVTPVTDEQRWTNSSHQETFSDSSASPRGPTITRQQPASV